MTAQELFGALVRSWGVLAALYGVYDLAYQAIKIFGFETTSHVAIGTGLAFSAVMLALGLFLMKGANLVVRFAYGRSLDSARPG